MYASEGLQPKTKRSRQFFYVLVHPIIVRAYICLFMPLCIQFKVVNPSKMVKTHRETMGKPRIVSGLLETLLIASYGIPALPMKGTKLQ